MDYVEPSAPIWQSVLGIVGFAAAVIGPILLALWAQRRRARGEEAGAGTAKGAESMLYTHGREI
jgi:Na+/proline symporter